MIKIIFKNKKSKAGFTLLEALVAISILMVAVAAPITIAQKGLSSASYSKNQMIASYLAQDAIEYLINKRDGVTINDGTAHDWAALWTDPDFSKCVKTDTNDNFCQIDTNLEGGKGGIVSDTNQVMKKTETDSFYGFGGIATIFTRKIQVIRNPDSDNQDEALITVTVSWGTGTVDSTNSVVVKTLIYNY